MKVGWVGELRRHAASTQRKALIEDGVSERKIYDGTKGELLSEALNDQRKGDVLCVLRLSALARGREGWRNFLELIHGKNVLIREVSTGLQGELAYVIAEMLMGALDDWAGEKRSPAQAKAAGKKGAEKRWGKRQRTPIRTASAIWKDWVKYPTPADALKHPDMRGWKVGMAYKLLGKRGAPAGPVPHRDT